MTLGSQALPCSKGWQQHGRKNANMAMTTNKFNQRKAARERQKAVRFDGKGVFMLRE